MTEIPTAAGKLYIATVIDLYSRRLLGAATSLHPDADLACAAIKMAMATRGGVDAVNGPGWREDESQRVIFHTDRGSTGGFNRSSQHLDLEVLDDKKAAGCRSCAASKDAFTRQVGFPAAG